MFKKTIVFFGISFICIAQKNEKLTVSVDSTVVRIGEQINYFLQVKADSSTQVVFPEQSLFAPFELLESSPVDTFKTSDHYLYTKKYSLIQFDSGDFYIPQQQVLIDGFSKISKLIPIRVNAIKVDTLKQKLYDIKPLEEVQKNYDKLVARILWGIVIIIILLGVFYTYLFKKRRKELKESDLPPFETAIEQLKALENENLNKQEEYKRYYSRLIEVVRVYLQEDAKIDALESTSDELLAKLEIRKDAGTLDLDRKTLLSLREVLQNADLVKFAKSMPEYRIANEDRKVVETVVIETKEALPEPTEEELKEKAAYQEYLEKKRRKEQWIWGFSGISILASFALVLSMLIYGYYPVRDTILLYPTKGLYSGQWISSQYGTPPLKIETPEVLERFSGEEKNIEQFGLGNFDSPFYIDLLFDFQSRNSQKPQSSNLDPKQADKEKGQALVNSIISNFESKGAVNILIKNDAVELPSGLSVAKVFGTLDYPKKGLSDRIRCSFNALLFTFEEGTIILTIMYEKEDRYAPRIEQRIINSIELIKEL
ncbi:MAG: hypothetical protein ACJ0PU_04345 [Flavobacteriaceae bacterium]